MHLLSLIWLIASQLVMYLLGRPIRQIHFNLKISKKLVGVMIKSEQKKGRIYLPSATG